VIIAIRPSKAPINALPSLGTSKRFRSYRYQNKHSAVLQAKYLQEDLASHPSKSKPPVGVTSVGMKVVWYLAHDPIE